MIFDNKTILITGGLGSFGRKFIEVVLRDYKPKAVRIYDNRELAQVEMEREFKDPRLRFLLGDVRDISRLNRAMRGVDIVVHAAALKHVSVCEYNPLEAVRTNIDGAINIIDAAIDNSVEKVIAISTDKAVQPVNLYGATKMVAEKLFIQGNSYVGGGKTIFSCSRYGNVVGSSGSIVPLFKKQRDSGELTITDESMTRFWITLEEGVKFVIKCIETMKGGEVFVPKISSMKIMDLAKIIAPEAKTKIIGVRPGEKMHEVLITQEEARHTKETKDFYVIEPEFPFWDNGNFKECKLLDIGFKYASDTNSQRIGDLEMQKMLKDLMDG
jgi:UDP-N-acetylglucosamine 4,6-dehydratase (inverting)